MDGREIAVGFQKFFSSENIPERLWSPPSSLLEEHVGLFPGSKVAGA